MRQLILISALSLFALSAHAAAETAPDACNQAASIEIAQCKAAQLKAEEARLDAVYAAALAGLPERDTTDSRKGKDQLRKSQIAWLKYRNDNCDYVGGQEGGSNIWVTIMSTDCAIAETKARAIGLKKYIY